MKDSPTLKRADAQFKNKKPLILSEADKKRLDKRKLKFERKKQAKELREKRNRGLETGEERFLPERDKGVARRLTRNYIDGHTSLSEIFMPVAFGIIILFYLCTSLIKNGIVASIIVLVMYAFMFAMIIEAIIKGVALNKYLNSNLQKTQIPRGTVWYGISRAFQFRPLRLPKPQVKRREFIESGK